MNRQKDLAVGGGVLFMLPGIMGLIGILTGSGSIQNDPLAIARLAGQLFPLVLGVAMVVYGLIGRKHNAK